MSRRPWFKCYPTDLLGGFRDLKPDEIAVYVTLLLIIYEMRRPVRDDDQMRAADCHMPIGRYRKARASLIQKEKLVLVDGHLHNERAMEVIADDASEEELLRQNGAIGGRKRAENAARNRAENLAKSQPVSNENNDLTQAPLGQTPKHTRSQSQNQKTPSESVIARQPDGSRLTADWRPDEACMEFARQQGCDPEATLAGFRDYWIGVPGQRGRKTDWPATWRNWCRREAERRPRTQAALPLVSVIDGGDPMGIKAWARSVPDAKMAADFEGIERPCINGCVLEYVAEEIAKIARLPVKPYDWSPVADWLRAGKDAVAVIVPAITAAVAEKRGNYRPPYSLRFFNDAVWSFRRSELAA